MSELKIGDWVVFRTRNWPKEVMRITLDEGETRNVTGEGLYVGRGKIIHAVEGGWTILEENSRVLVTVDPGEHIEPMSLPETDPLTLGELRRFLDEHKDAPDNTPILVSLPIGFVCDEDSNRQLPEDHPDAHTPDMFHSIAASHLIFTSLEEMTDLAEQFEDAGEGLHAGPQIEIILLPLEAHEALRDCDVGELETRWEDDNYHENGNV
jgi:hypothetical protein